MTTERRHRLALPLIAVFLILCAWAFFWGAIEAALLRWFG